MDRQERRIGLLPLLAQRGQHDRHDGVVALEHRQQRRVEAAGAVAFRRRQELVVEAERVEEGAQARVVVCAEAVMRAERIGHLGERLVEVLRHHLPVRDVVRHLAQAVHVVREGDEPGRDRVSGQDPEGVAHHAGARHLAEGADMRQARGAVAGLEQRLFLAGALETFDELARLLERPGVRSRRDLGKGGIHGKATAHRLKGALGAVNRVQEGRHSR